MSEVLKGLANLMEAEEPIARAMGSAMGIEVRDEAKARVPVGTNEYGSKNPGLLQRSIYVAYDDHMHVLSPHRYEYVVSWNRKKAPHGHLIEFGHWMPYQYQTDYQGNFWTIPIEQRNGPVWVAARPFLGPAYYAKMPVLYSVAVTAGAKRFREVAK